MIEVAWLAVKVGAACLVIWGLWILIENIYKLTKEEMTRKVRTKIVRQSALLVALISVGIFLMTQESAYRPKTEVVNVHVQVEPQERVEIVRSKDNLGGTDQEAYEKNRLENEQAREEFKDL